MNDTTNTVTKIMMGGFFNAELCGVVFDLRWWVGFLFTLLVFDFWFGRSESKKKSEEFRWSRCIRRSINKLCDYTAYMVIGFFIGGAILQPIGWCTPVAGAIIGICLACLAEVCSVVGHVFYLHDIKFSIKKFIIALVKFRWNELGTALEKATEEVVEPINQDDHENIDR